MTLDDIYGVDYDRFPLEQEYADDTNFTVEWDEVDEDCEAVEAREFVTASFGRSGWEH